MSGEPNLPIELQTISETPVIDRKLSSSPEPIETINPSTEAGHAPVNLEDAAPISSGPPSRANTENDPQIQRRPDYKTPDTRHNAGTTMGSSSQRKPPSTTLSQRNRIVLREVSGSRQNSTASESQEAGGKAPLNGPFKFSRRGTGATNRKDTGARSPTYGAPSRSFTEITNASLSLEETQAWDSKAVLSLDGGGIRGYSSLLIIKELMNKIAQIEWTYTDEQGREDRAETSFHPCPPVQHVSPSNSSANSNSSSATECTQSDSSRYLPCHYFDYMAGTSTGGLISIMLGRLRMNIDDCITDYETLGNEVFGHCRWFHLRSPLFWPRDKYNHKTLQEVIKRVVNDRVPRVANFPGGRNFAYDENRCRTVVISYQKNTEKGVDKPYLFRTYKHLHQSPPNSEQRALDRNPNLAHDIPIWKVGRATSAAPTYFEPPTIDGLQYLDGGFGANNPSQEIYREVKRMSNGNAKAIGLLLSIGTGKSSGSRFTDSTGLWRFSNYMKFMKKLASDTEETHTNMLDISTTSEFTYFRFNVANEIGEMKLDEWKTRGKLRRGLGIAIGKVRRLREPSHKSKQLERSRSIGETAVERDLNRSNEIRGDGLLNIPEWFKAKHKTIEFIARHTTEYLETTEIDAWLSQCARYLVEGRRKRAKADPERWERTCFGTWYQCNQDKCLRGEKEYQDRDSLKRHLRDKHRNEFTRENVDKLERTLNDCKILVQ